MWFGNQKEKERKSQVRRMRVWALSKLENDCLSVLKYASDKWPRFVSITELSEALNIPPSTLRNIFLVAKRGIFIKYDEENERTSIHGDVFSKIATKYRFSYVLKKMKNENGHATWYISAVHVPYNND